MRAERWMSEDINSLHEKSLQDAMSKYETTHNFIIRDGFIWNYSDDKPAYFEYINYFFPKYSEARISMPSMRRQYFNMRLDLDSIEKK